MVTLKKLQNETSSCGVTIYGSFMMDPVLLALLIRHQVRVKNQMTLLHQPSHAPDLAPFDFFNSKMDISAKSKPF